MNDILKKTLTLSDAIKISKPLKYNLMIKTVGSMCNLNCDYCYYLDKSALYHGVSIMSLDMLEKIIRNYVETNAAEELVFNWHGGEPLLAGLDYYKEITKLQNKYCGNKKICNTLQTNAVLVNEEFASFFKDNNFLIGVSIDGPQDIHDRYRKDKLGNPTFKKVIKGIELLHRHNVDFNTMTTINKASESRGLEVYLFLKQIGSQYMQFMPVVEYVNSLGRIVPPNYKEATLAPWSVESMAFGEFMCDIFDSWVKNDVGTYFVNLFDSTLANICGVECGCCAYSDTCGLNAVVEHNGDVYPCDHFVYPEYRLGNITENDIYEIVSSSQMVEFGINKRNLLPRKCFSCDFFHVCHGECPKHRFLKIDKTDKGLNCLCDGYRLFYAHIQPFMDIMRDLIMQQRSPSEIMRMI